MRHAHGILTVPADSTIPALVWITMITFQPCMSQRARWIVLAIALPVQWLGLSGCGEPPQPPHESSSAGQSAVAARSAPANSAADEPESPSPPASARTADETETDKASEWLSLFDGESLGKWEITRFGGEGDVEVSDGQIILSQGNDMTGVTWTGEPPARMNYELELEAMRVQGNDFFCGLTFPVGEDPCTLICGGWGGGLTGLSSLDFHDASENETSKWIDYKQDRWYRIRIRVVPGRITAWLDDESLVDVVTTGRKIGIRPEVDLSRPLGIATWRTTGAIRKVRFRSLPAE
jgi:hypothetical protein